MADRVDQGVGRGGALPERDPLEEREGPGREQTERRRLERQEGLDLGTEQRGVDDVGQAIDDPGSGIGEGSGAVDGDPGRIG